MIDVFDTRALPRLPAHRPGAVAASLAAHGVTIGLVLVSTTVFHRASPVRLPATLANLSLSHLIFVARDSTEPSGGGGGGGNQQTEPIRRAAARGADEATLRVAAAVSPVNRDAPAPDLPQLVLDAKPLASGNVEQLGLPTGGVSAGSSLGPGQGRGVDDGIGPGIGVGRGPGLGPGAEGNMGGDVRRAGGAVTAPRVVLEVKPRYTNRAMLAHIEGTVLLELVVRANGVPSNIRVVRSLDPGGLDDEAIRVASQWRFEPGRMNGVPVDVFASLALDFHIR
jgi:protein TonB